MKRVALALFCAALGLLVFNFYYEHTHRKYVYLTPPASTAPARTAKVHENSDGTIWFTSKNDGVWTIAENDANWIGLDSKTGKMTKYDPKTGKTEDYIARKPSSVRTDKNGDVWIAEDWSGKTDDRVLKFDPTTSKFTTYRLPTGSPTTHSELPALPPSSIPEEVASAQETKVPPAKVAVTTAAPPEASTTASAAPPAPSTTAMLILSNPSETLTLFRILISAVLLIPSLYIILFRKDDPTAKNFACSTIGTIVGFWLTAK